MNIRPSHTEKETLSPFKEKLSKNFGGASHYDDVAYIQKRAAHHLLEHIQKQQITPKTILEIGCGTGFLSEMLLSSFALQSQFHFTDLSPKMLTRTKEKLKAHPSFILSEQEQCRFYVMDGENPSPSSCNDFDLIASNLCIQWFTNHQAAFQKLTNHLAPHGILATTTLLRGSLQQWRLSCEKTGVACGVPLYPTCEEMIKAYPLTGKGSWHIITLEEPISSAFSFLKNLQKIGASLPISEHRPLKFHALKRAMSYFDTHYSSVTYQIGLGIFKKDSL